MFVTGGFMRKQLLLLLGAVFLLAPEVFAASTATWVRFAEPNITMLGGATVQLTLLGVDDYAMEAPVQSDRLIQLRSYDMMEPMIDEPGAFSMSNNLWVSISSVTISSGSTHVSFYYKASTATASNYRMIMASHTLNSGGFWPQPSALVNIVSGGLDYAYVHNGNYYPATTLNMGTDDTAYIDFSLQDSMPWEVSVATYPQRATAVWKAYGSGTPEPGQVSWNGYFDYYDQETEIYHTEKAPNGTYYIRIKLGAAAGSGIVNDSLSVVIQSLEITGTVQDANLEPVPGVYVSAYGPSYSYAITDSEGHYALSGLVAGSYTLNFNRPGYSPYSVSDVEAGSTLDIELSRPGYIKINAQRGISAMIANEELWGNVQIISLDGENEHSGSLHFQVGISTSDNGMGGTGSYTVINNTGSIWEAGKWTILEVAPGTYSLAANLEGFDEFTSTLTVAAGGTTIVSDVLFSLKKTVYGTVKLPATVSDAGGVWISVEAIPEGYSYSTGWASTQIPQSKSSGTYTLTGLSAGKYTIRTYAPGYRRASVSTTIAAGDEILGAPMLEISDSAGITGTVTVEGDTNDPSISQWINGSTDFMVFLNAWSPDSYGYGWTSVSIAKNSTTASNPFTIKGLDDGTYWLNSWLYGFDLEGAVGWNGVKVVVSGGAGTVDLKFKRYSGKIKCTLKVPDSDWPNVAVSLNGMNIWLQDITHSNFSSYGLEFDDGTGVLTSPALGTGFYQLKVVYGPTGMQVTRNLMVTNGQTKETEIDLSGNTHTVSGVISIDPNNRPVSSGASPYSDMSALVSDANAVLPDGFLIRAIDYAKTNTLTTITGAGDGVMPASSTISSDGTFTIRNLVPGVYTLKVDGLELDASSGGKETAPIDKVVAVKSDVSGLALKISKGYTIGGKIKIGSGELITRSFMVALFKSNMFKVSSFGKNDWATNPNAYGYIAQTEVTMTASDSANYSFTGLEPGSYVVAVSDYLQGLFSRQYANAAVNVTIAASNMTGQDITLVKGGRITFKLRDADSGTIITPRNREQMLSDTFMASAIANPWVEGGWGDINTIVGSTTDTENFFRIPFLPEATYDLIIGQSQYGLTGSAAYNDSQRVGNKTDYAQKTVSSIKVKNGQTNDIGIVDIKQGVSISGKVTNSSSQGIANIPVMAVPALTNEWSSQLRGFTDINGNYSIVGLNPDTVYYDVIACPRLDPALLGGLFFYGSEGLAYGEQVRSMVKIAGGEVVDFVLSEAKGGIKGAVVTEDGGDMQNPDDLNLPTAKIYMQKDDTFPRTNPVGDIVADTSITGAFEIGALAPGAYTLLVISGGYGSYAKSVTVSETIADLGTITLKRGARISGTVTKPDGKNPSTTEVRSVIAATDDFSELLYGSLKTSGEKTVTGYELNGFQAGSSYNIVFLSEGDELVPAENSYSVPYSTYTKADKNLIFQPSVPTVFSRAKRDSVNKNLYAVNFSLTGALRKSVPADDQLSNIITRAAGAGTLTERYMAYNRKSLSCYYTAPAGEAKFTLNLKAYSKAQDPATGKEFLVDSSIIYYSGIGATNKVRVSNMRGARVTLDGDSSNVQFGPGSFNVGSSTSVDVEFSRADNLLDFGSRAPGKAARNFRVPRSADSYPAEIYKAMQLLEKAQMDPFSSFYEILLPATISHSLRKDATLTVECAAGSDLSKLNIYYYDPVNNVYLLENASKRSDAAANTISVSINHVSIFVALQSNASVITGVAYNGPLFVYNYPNPFDLNAKSVTLANGTLGSQSQTVNGTCIHYGLPTDISGDVEIKIYNVAGELVRALSDPAKTGGSHYYIEWDGKNEAGKKVASGVYIARFTADKKNEKFFKMAVIK